MISINTFFLSIRYLKIKNSEFFLITSYYFKIYKNNFTKKVQKYIVKTKSKVFIIVKFQIIMQQIQNKFNKIKLLKSFYPHKKRKNLVQ